MSYNQSELLGGLFAIAFLAVVVFLMAISGLTYSRCLSLGYPAAKVDMFMNRYCVIRVDQTDRVIPLAEARQQ